MADKPLTPKQLARKQQLARKRKAKEKAKADRLAGKPRRKKRKVKALMSAGQRIGKLKLLGRVRAPKSASPATRTRWRCECDCGNIVVVPQMYFRRENPKSDCGECGEQPLRAKYNRTYRIWLMVRMRTRDKTHASYKHYKARGINIIDEWYDLATGFEKFLEHVGPCEDRALSLDRIDNVRGYEPDNIRWATAAQQRANQGDMVAGYTEEQIVAAGFTRLAFTKLIAKGADEHQLIKDGAQNVEAP